jgi:nucleoside-diphosphate-sugar epimerase
VTAGSNRAAEAGVQAGGVTNVEVTQADTPGDKSFLIADHVTGKPPVVTREGVILALRSAPFDSAKATRELGYAPEPIDRALTEVVEAFKRGSSST